MSKKTKHIFIICFIIIVIIACIIFIVSFYEGFKKNNMGNKNQTSGSIGTNPEIGATSPITPTDSITTPSLPNENTYYTQDASKVIKKSNITMQTDDYVNSLSNINKLIKDSDAMIVKMQETQGNNYYLTKMQDSELRSADIIIKVSKDKFENFNNEIKKYGNVVSYYEDAQDISSTYSDIEAKISSYVLQEQQLKELLKKATAAKDLLEISNQIQSVIEKREYLQRQKNSYDNQIEYSTVTLKLAEVESTKITEKNMLTRIKDTFISSLSQMKDIGINIVMFIVYVIPYILLLLIVIAIIYAVIKSRKKSKK